MDRRNPLNEDAPHDHDQHKPMIDWVSAYQFHIRRGEDI